MRILIVSLFYAPEVTGIGPYSADLAQHLTASGHRVMVLTTYPFYPHWRRLQGYTRRGPWMKEDLRGVRVWRTWTMLPREPHRALHRIVFDTSFAVTTTPPALLIPAYDVVLCVSPPLQGALTGLIAARLRGIPFLLHIQDVVPDAAIAVGVMREGTALTLARRLEKFVYSHSDLISVISKGFRANLLAKGVPPEKIRLLPNWIDCEPFDSPATSNIRAQLKAADHDTVVLHTGNMGEKQGLFTVLEAAALLAGDRFRFGLIGDGLARPRLEKHAAMLGLTRLQFLPLQPDLPATLGAADLLVLSQLGDVIDSVAPSKLLAYMASGRAVVAAVNEQSEAGRVVADAGCGVVVPPEQPQRLAEALRDLGARPEVRARLGTAGRRYVRERFARASLLRRWDELLAEVMSTPHKRRSPQR